MAECFGRGAHADITGMDCSQAHKLFDAYLDGELSPTLASELAAHRLRCAACRRALALIEVSSRVLLLDQSEPSLDEEFTDRLLACMNRPYASPWLRYRNRLVVFGSLATAAVVALAFLAPFSPERHVAGNKVTRDPLIVGDRSHEHRDFSVQGTPGVRSSVAERQPAESPSQVEVDLAEWIRNARTNIEAGSEESGAVMERIDLTILQLLDILESARDPASAWDHYPAKDASQDDEPGDVEEL